MTRKRFEGNRGGERSVLHFAAAVATQLHTSAIVFLNIFLVVNRLLFIYMRC